MRRGLGVRFFWRRREEPLLELRQDGLALLSKPGLGPAVKVLSLIDDLQRLRLRPRMEPAVFPSRKTQWRAF
jgi:hypothetical protein